MAACRIPSGVEAMPCPWCGQRGVVVGHAPVRAHRPSAAEDAWHHCPTASCGAVFYLGADVIDTDHVVARVGHKAPGKPEPVCFCFAHTVEALARDAARHGGTSTIKASIRAEVAAGRCACEHLNPSGRCCLPELRRTLRAIAAEQLRTTVAR